MAADKESIKAAYLDVRDDATPNTWALFDYSEDGKLISHSKSGVEYAEFLDNLTDDNRVYGYVRVDCGDEMSKRAKFILVTWVGQDVGALKKAKVSTDKAFVKQVCDNFSIEVLVFEKEELESERLLELVTKAAGANYGTGKRD